MVCLAAQCSVWKQKCIFICLMGSGIISMVVVHIFTIRDRGVQTRQITERRNGNGTSLLDYKTILTPRFNKTRLFLLILVLSKPDNFENRKAIRETWANRNASFFMTSKAIFLIGQSSVNASVTREYDQYNDIILGSVKDSYTNLVSKVHMGFSWALHRLQFEYLIKCDDDVYLNVRRLFKWLKSSRSFLPKHLYGGFIHWKEKPNRRVGKVQNALSKNDFADDFFPPYAAGPVYILSHSALKLMVNASHFVKPFPVEDTFMGCLAQYSGIKPYHVRGIHLKFTSKNDFLQYGTCGLFEVFVFAHQLSPNLLRKLHFKVSEFETMANSGVAIMLCIQEQLPLVYKVVVGVAFTCLSIFLIYILICRTFFGKMAE